MQTAIAGKDIELNNISTYWVSKGEVDQGSTISKVEFDEEGYVVNNFPEEVFQEVYEQAKNLLEVREHKGA